MLDEMYITRKGRIVLTSKSILIEGFDGKCESCRELAVLALVWGIGELQKELREQLKKPGGSGKLALN